MFKKLLLASAVLALGSQVALAGAPYVGVGVGMRVNTNNVSSFRGMPGSLFAGYGANVGQGIYLAGEINGTLATANITDNGLRSTYDYGLSLIPGIMISDHTLGYLRVGYIRTNFSPAGAKSETVNGGQLGLGLQTSLMQDWDLRGEYTFGAYSSLHHGAGTNPRSDEFTLALIYKFD